MKLGGSLGLLLLCWLTLVRSAAIDHHIRARSPDGEDPTTAPPVSEPAAQSSSESGAQPGSQGDGNNEPRTGSYTPYIQQYGSGAPPPPPLPPNPGMGGPSVFYPGGLAYHKQEEVQVNLECLKTYMNVYLKFQKPFMGYVYPFGLADKCVLVEGRGETEIKLSLYQDPCGAPLPPPPPGYAQRVDPFMEHRLMIQWDTDLVQEYDSNILLRCDRPEDYTRNIKFDLASVVGENQKTLVQTHPGPKLWMEIQDGEGPTAPPLVGPVFLGQTLSLVFTLADEVFNFDSNVLDCWATDGKSTQALVPYSANPAAPTRPLITSLQVIQESCSVKPKLFGNFNKLRQPHGSMKTTTEWVLFKAFRFPTSSRVLVQCNVQVCFEKCQPLRPCEVYSPRSERKRRSTNDTSSGDQVNPETLTMYRAIEVFLPKDTENMPMAVVNGSVDMVSRMLQPRGDCLSSTTFYGVILGLGIVLLIIIAVVAVYVQRQVKKNRANK